MSHYIFKKLIVGSTRQTATVFADGKRLPGFIGKYEPLDPAALPHPKRPWFNNVGGRDGDTGWWATRNAAAEDLEERARDPRTL